MFTGIVEELGEVVAVDDLGDSARLRVRGPLVTADVAPGDSLAVNGVCLTVVDAGDGVFTTEAVAETLHRTNLTGLHPGSPVNLERARPLGGRLGGHLVQGHVDGTGTVVARTPGEHGELVRFGMPASLARYVVDKGSIAVDGVSLTVVEAGADTFTVSLIPATLAATTLGRAAVGDQVNLEVDVLAKYVERLLGHGAAAGTPRGGQTTVAQTEAGA